MRIRWTPLAFHRCDFTSGSARTKQRCARISHAKVRQCSRVPVLSSPTASLPNQWVAIDSPSVRIHLDTFHMHIEEQSVYSAILHAGEDLVYMDASESDRGTPGKGQVHWQEVARALRDIEYKGDCVIESFTSECETIAAAAAIWRPLAPSQDELASEGCRFLTDMFSSERDTHQKTPAMEVPSSADLIVGSSPTQ